MYRTIIRVLASVILISSLSGVAVGYEGNRLLNINGIVYTDEDFRHWWTHWNDKKNNLVQSSLENFISFMLFVQQGEEMGYDSQPNYLHKLEVFLQVRALMELKYEEVDSKILVTEEDLRKYFEERYGTVWTLQILGFDTESKAAKAYDSMLPYDRQVGGRLVFADLIGGGAEEKAETYDEVKVVVEDFYKNKRVRWLSVVQNLSDAEVAKPFLSEDNNKYILIRLIDKQPAGDGVFEEKREKISEQLLKNERARLTVNLIKNLKSKYDVKVDQELFKIIQLDEEYQSDFLDRKIITSSIFDATVRDLLFNIKKEKKVRKDIADDEVKDLVLNSLISQTLVNKESLVRGYENIPPLKWTYDFYKQNRLKQEVESGLSNSVVISDLDLKNYYDLHASDYSIPDKVTYLIVHGDEELLKKVWLGTLQGTDFSELLSKYSLDSNKKISDINSLPQALTSILNNLTKGEVSVPFALDTNSFALLKLLDRVPGKVVPFQDIKNKVTEQFKKEKFEILKNDYLIKLKSKSDIIVNENVWNSLLRELANGTK
ncbi:MAG: hypothetical protein HGA96_14040 [Desulfobulbaceae bacterium]|nr:hypothetical protein [Desulfobulbaceae bacterium]